ncbi:MAG: hypothetical protein RLZZ427_1813 [Pseudomonadota bacterium]|jgi:hypothetical protein
MQMKPKSMLKHCLLVGVMLVSGCDKLPASLGGKAAKPVQLTEYPEHVYWGDTHLHTANSPDAFGFGNRLGPEEALRFARGEEVTSTMGVKAKLARPLDFLVIADHSDGLGFVKALADAPRFLLPNDKLKHWHDMFNAGPEQSSRAMGEMIDFAGSPEAKNLADPKKVAEQTASLWAKHIKTVEAYNEPGKFTAFFGFEYTLMPSGNNLHRVVMFRDGPDKVSKVQPYTTAMGDKPEDLWNYMEAYERTAHGRVLAIPHNSNVSNGLMFELTGPGGGAMTAAQARRRAAREPLVEVTQIKGDSEAHPFLSPSDEFAGFGVQGWDKANLNAKQPTTPAMYGGNYVREALKRGLVIAGRTGVNPYRFGLIGSTDSHTGLSTADEDNFFGKHTGNEPTPQGKDRVTPAMDMGTNLGRYNWQYLAGGYAGVWARGNTRAAIFDAMMRREVYATTGPRMTVRFFGGWDFARGDLAGNWVKSAYRRGVPMGGVLTARGKGAPSFIVSALKDPIGANLDRVQVVKGWTDARGKAREKVFDVAWSSPETRKPVRGKLPTVGNTVNLAVPNYANSIGAPSLVTVWRDPEFDPAARAFYYVRVIEIPTPRWVAYDAARYHLKLGPEIQQIAQERAYTSPIWYEPKP